MKSPLYKESDNKTSMIVIVTKLFIAVTSVLLAISILLTFMSAIGMYTSEESATTVYVFSLAIPMWINVRETFVDLLEEISK